MDWEIIAEDLRFPEGPVAMPDGSVIVAEIAAGRITKVLRDGTKDVIVAPGGGPNGLAIGPDGKLYVCNNGGLSWLEQGGLLQPHGTAADYDGGRIERVDLATGAIEVLYRSGDFDCAVRGPNDLVFDTHGGFYFTDYGKSFERSRDVTGLCYARMDGTLLKEVVHPLESPNGVGLSPDGSTVYVAETYTCRLWAFAILAPGVLGPGVPLHRPAGFKFFDSLGVEDGGNICVATIGESGITIVDPSGAVVDFVSSPDPFTTNIAWGGADMCTAYVTFSSSGRLAKKRWPRPGLKLVGQFGLA